MLSQVQFLLSPNLTKLNIKHGFFKKYGGLSSSRFQSLNVKKGIGDSDQNVAGNLKLACKALKLKPQQLVFIRHSFEDSILVVDEKTEVGEYQGYDAVITNRKDIVLAQGIADCGNVMISDKNKQFIGLIHGSWHTTKLNIIERTLGLAEKLYGTQAEDIIIAFGPMLCQNCFEFGDEATQMFESKYLKLEGGRYYFNNKQKMLDQLLQLGIKKGSIWDAPVCTMESPDFFSYRKARKAGHSTGRFLNLISLV